MSQLDMFPPFSVEEMHEIEKIKEIQDQQNTLRKGFFKRYQEQNERISKLENMFADLLELIHHNEERNLENMKWIG